jgi:hypothetical protein
MARCLLEPELRAPEASLAPKYSIAYSLTERHKGEFQKIGMAQYAACRSGGDDDTTVAPSTGHPASISDSEAREFTDVLLELPDLGQI